MKGLTLGKIKNIEYIFFKFTSLDLNQFIIIKNYFINFNIVNNNIIDNKHSKELILIINDNISKNVLSNLIKKFTTNINNYEIHLIKFNNIISILNVKIYSIIYQNNKISTSSNTYSDLSIFFKKKKVFKNSFIDKNENDNKCKNVFIKINNFQKLNINLNKLFYLFRLFGNINLLYYDFTYGTVFFSFKEIIYLNNFMDCKKYMYYNKTLINVSLTKLKKYNNKNTIKKIEFENNINIYDKYLLKKNNIPSDTIIIANFKNYNNIFKWYKLIKEFGNPILMNFIKIKNIKIKVCVVKFSSILETIKIIIAWSNIKFGKKRLRIFFSNFKFKYNNV